MAFRGTTPYGPPTSGTYALGDMVGDNEGGLWVCTVPGTPGSWAPGTSLLTAGGAMDGYLAAAGVQLAYASQVAVNAAEGNVFYLTLAGSCTIATPSSPPAGLASQGLRFHLTQGAGGGFTPSWGAGYNFGTAGQPSWSSAAGDIDVVSFVWDPNAAQWFCAGSALGY
jgi:hypothetical protein